MDILSANVARAAATNTQLDLHDLMYRFTLDSFGKIGFGVQLGCLSSSDAKVPFAVAFDQAQVVSAAATAAASSATTSVCNRLASICLKAACRTNTCVD
jgi:hypothetical protein